MLKDNLHQHLIIIVEQLEHVGGPGVAAQSGKPADVDKHHGDETIFAALLHCQLSADHHFGQVRREQSPEPLAQGCVALHLFSHLFAFVDGVLGVRTENGKQTQHQNPPPDVVQLHTQYVFQKVVIGSKNGEKRVEQPENRRQSESDHHHLIGNRRTSRTGLWIGAFCFHNGIELFTRCGRDPDRTIAIAMCRQVPPDRKFTATLHTRRVKYKPQGDHRSRCNSHRFSKACDRSDPSRIIS